MLDSCGGRIIAGVKFPQYYWGWGVIGGIAWAKLSCCAGAGTTYDMDGDIIIGDIGVGIGVAIDDHSTYGIVGTPNNPADGLDVLTETAALQNIS